MNQLESLSGVRTSRWVFMIAGFYGIMALAPNYFLEDRIGRDAPPPITHVEYFYGFIGVAIAWQIVFLMIGRDPIRFRPIMLAGVLEKVSFASACVALFAAGRLAPIVLAAGLIDLIFAVLFMACFWLTRR